MKKYLFFATALVALASCSSNDYIGEQPPVSSQSESGAIKFGTGLSAVTRGDHVGADAANLLNNNFVVGGFKGDLSVATTVVFDNYNVNYVANTAETTESNAKNWEYVGLDVNALASIPNEAGEKQTIKYWDYSQAQYDFIAYSLGNGNATATTITPSTATSSTGGAYTLTGTTAQLKTVHIADLKTVLKANYNEPVELSFRNFASKVRIALYETVPGYSVRDVKFYTSDDPISGGSTSTTAALYASSSVLPTAGTYTIYFPTVNNGTPTSDKNKAHVDFTTSTSKQSNQTFGDLTSNYTTAEKHEPAGPYYLGRESNSATFAGTTAPFYQDVLPYENGTSLTLKVDYTLVSTDGSNETITVVGAKAVVPLIFAQWKPGYAYTYIFKISDNTKGWTSGVEGEEVSGLNAITFDAVVEATTEDNIQETVTTVATPSITTYQHDPAKNVTADNEYTAGTVYARVMNDGTLISDLNGVAAPAKDEAKLYSLNRDASEADVMDALLKQSKKDETTIYGRNGLVLTQGTCDNTITAIPGADGNNITVAAGTASALTVAANTKYAYVYTVSQKTNETQKYEVVPVTVGVTVVTGYYTESGGDYTPVTIANTKAADGVTYYDRYTVNDGVYAVKVIKVKP